MKAFQHYTATQPKPFLKEERETVTILYEGLTWKHKRILQGVLENLHYKAEPLPDVSHADLITGKELVDVGACCPTTFTAGSLVNFLRSEMNKYEKEEIARRYVYLTAGSCGACRFGQFHQSYTLAMETIGLSGFRILLMAQDQLNKRGENLSGWKMNIPFATGFVWALLCTDILTDLEYQTRPYELVPGQTLQAVKESVELLYRTFRDRPIPTGRWRSLYWHFTSDYFIDALRKVYSEFAKIEVDRLRVKAKVKISGEFWLQAHEGEGNYNIKKWLEMEGAEVVPPPVSVWLDYMLRFKIQELDARSKTDRFATLKKAGLKALQWLFRHTYQRMRKAVENLPMELPDQYELFRLAAPYYHCRLSGGEGDMLVGKALYTYHRRLAHMICELSPHSCMPNTMSVGAMANVLGKYPDLLYAAIEVKGDAEIQALSRCQMILAEAKKNAQLEYQEVLSRTGLNGHAIQVFLDSHPDMKKATYRIPHAGVCGTSANLVLHVVEKMRSTKGRMTDGKAVRS